MVTQEEGLEVITTQSQRLIDMVDKLLQLSRLEAVDEHWPAATVDLRTMAEEAAMLLMPEAARRDLKLTVEGESLQVTIPSEHLFRILVNLLQNAVRHTTDQVVIRVDPEVPAAAWAIHIEDNGPGLAEGSGKRSSSVSTLERTE